MKSLKSLGLAVLASLTLISCSKEGGITVTNDAGQSVSDINIGPNGGTSSDYTVKTADGSDWSVTTSGIPGMYAEPTSGHTNFYFCIVIPENTGAARTGHVTVTGGNNLPKTITVNQTGK